MALLIAVAISVTIAVAVSVAISAIFVRPISITIAISSSFPIIISSIPAAQGQLLYHKCTKSRHINHYAIHNLRIPHKKVIFPRQVYFTYCKTLFFRYILISRFSYVENLLHLNLADFFIKICTVLLFTYYKKNIAHNITELLIFYTDKLMVMGDSLICVYLISRFCSNRENLMLAKYVFSICECFHRHVSQPVAMLSSTEFRMPLSRSFVNRHDSTTLLLEVISDRPSTALLWS